MMVLNALASLLLAGSVAQAPDPIVEPVEDREFLLHVVQPGETLYRIGLNYDVPFEEIARLNEIGPSWLIFAGGGLVVRGDCVDSDSICIRQVRVLTETTLGAIAAELGFETALLETINRSTENTRLPPGKLVFVPGGAAAAAEIEDARARAWASLSEVCAGRGIDIRPVSAPLVIQQGASETLELRVEPSADNAQCFVQRLVATPRSGFVRLGDSALNQVITAQPLLTEFSAPSDGGGAALSPGAREQLVRGASLDAPMFEIPVPVSAETGSYVATFEILLADRTMAFMSVQIDVVEPVVEPERRRWLDLIGG